MTLTKKDIVRIVTDKSGLTQLKTKEVVQSTLDAIIEILVETGRLELRNFGVFKVKTRKGRRARNPRSGQAVFVAAKQGVSFKPGRVMLQRLRRRSPSTGDLATSPPSSPPEGSSRR